MAGAPDARWRRSCARADASPGWRTHGRSVASARLITGTTASPSATASSPPGMKVGCTSTSPSMSVARSIIGLAPCAVPGDHSMEHPRRGAMRLRYVKRQRADDDRAKPARRPIPDPPRSARGNRMSSESRHSPWLLSGQGIDPAAVPHFAELPPVVRSAPLPRRDAVAPDRGWPLPNTSQGPVGSPIIAAGKEVCGADTEQNIVSVGRVGIERKASAEIRQRCAGAAIDGDPAASLPRHRAVRIDGKTLSRSAIPQDQDRRLSCWR